MSPPRTSDHSMEGRLRRLAASLPVALAWLLAVPALAPAQEAGPPTLELRPSADLMRLISETPSGFAWSSLDRELRVGLSGSPSSGVSRIRVCAAVVRGSDVTESACSEPGAAGPDELTRGLPSGELTAGGSVRDRLEEWLPRSEWVPARLFVPSGAVEATRRAVVERALAGESPREDEALVVLWAAPADRGATPEARTIFALLTLERKG